MAGCERGRRGRGRKRMHSDDGWGGHGGYMNAKIEKLGKQSSPDKKSSDLFKDVSIFINGYTNPPQDELKRLVVDNGGAYIHYYSLSKVTHIIATNLPKSKISQLRNEKVVKPEWITDSIQAGRLLPCKEYFLYDQKGAGIKTGLMTSLTYNSSSLSTTVCVDKTSSLSTSVAEDQGLLPELLHEDSETLYEFGRISDESGAADKIGPDVEGQSGIETNVVTQKQNLSSVATAGDPGFVSEFYNNSRLHHLSTWGAEFKSYVASLQKQANVTYPAREKLRQKVTQWEQNSKSCDMEDSSSTGKHQRVLMHIDMDCFFVSVALRNRPELKGRPVAVTHSKGRGPVVINESVLAAERAHWHQGSSEPERAASHGDLNQTELRDAKQATTQPNKDVFYSMAEVASCSYEARQVGVKNGMLFGKAKQRCPELIPVPYDFEGYKTVSQQLYDIVGSYTLDIEAVSCDELYVDCGDVVADTGASILEFATLLREEIFEKTGCTASAGLGGNMLLARLATKVAKPNGQFFVEPSAICEFMEDKLVSDLPGVGHVMSSKLESLNVRTCGELQTVSLPQLQKHFGQKTGQMLYRCARGEDERALKTSVERKSVSAEINYGIRFVKMNEAEKFLSELATEVRSRLTKINKKGRTVTLKLKVRQEGAPKTTAKFLGHGICDSLCKSTTLPMATDNAVVIGQECCALLKQFRVEAEDLRGIGIQMTFLESADSQPISASGCRSILEFAAPRGSVAETDPNCQKPVKKKPASVSDMLLSSSKALNDSSRQSVSGTNLVNANCKIKKSTNSDSSLPPLPMLGSINSSVEETESVASGKCLSPLLELHESYLPSPSQIDENILGELPEDIQAEIRQAMKNRTSSLEFGNRQRAFGRKEEKSQSEPLVDEQRPGCSHWTTDVVSNRSSKDSSDAATLPPYSQLDASYLEALPPELREEIEQAYATNRNELSNKLPDSDSRGLHPLMKAEVKQSSKPQLSKTSPGKKGSPKGSSPKKASPSFKVPRGRPPGKRKNTFSKRTLFPEKMAVVPLQNSSESLVDQNLNTDVLKTVETMVKPNRNDVRVAGCVTLDQVKQLLRGWIQSSPVPNKENLKSLSQYFMQLIQKNNLERVNVLLKFINRISQTDALSTDWKTGSRWIIDQVQSAMCSIYGGPIKLPEPARLDCLAPAL